MSKYNNTTKIIHNLDTYLVRSIQKAKKILSNIAMSIISSDA